VSDFWSLNTTNGALINAEQVIHHMIHISEGELERTGERERDRERREK